MADYISREAAIDAVDVCNLHRGIIDALQAIISDIPSADVRPVKYGRWIELENPNYSPFDPTSREYDLLCSNCGAKHYGKERNFCPNCGADMREAKADG